MSEERQRQTEQEESMNTQEIMKEADECLLHVYNRFPVAFDHGEGVRLYDAEGKEYLDFASGIGVMAFGYGDEEYKEALKAQIDKITQTSNLYYHAPMAEAAKAAVRISGMDRIFFTNSGAEAIEGAIKTAKKYAYLKTGKTGHGIVAMQHSFHGRTVGAVSVTGNDHYRDPFYPLMEGVSFAKFNDIESVRTAVKDDTCAILLEPIQGEGGIFPATKEFLEEVRKLCDEKDILLIFDEIQCGMGRSGAYFVWQKYGIRPDILTSAKALGAGVPVGAFLVTEKVAESSLAPGDHGTTYGGNPFVCTAVAKTVEMMENRKILEHVESVTPYLEQALEELTTEFGFIEKHRGMGFMQGLVLDGSVKPGAVVKKALEEGLVILSAGENVVRFLPPLIIEEKDVDEMKEKMRRILAEVSE